MKNRVHFTNNKMWYEIMAHHEIIWQLFIRSLLAKYKKTFLGIIWALVLPLIIVGIFVFLHQSGVLNIGDIHVPYPIFAFFGLMLWLFFSDGLILSTHCLIRADQLITKASFPKETLIFASLYQLLFDFLIRSIILIMLLIFFNITPSWKSIFIPFLLLPLLFFTLGCGFLCAVFAVYVRDLIYAIPFVTAFLLCLSPILYAKPQYSFLNTVNIYNPLAILITTIRSFFFTGTLLHPILFAITYIFSAGLFVFSWRFFRISEPYIAEKI
jgi:lipopolysaccharide transport system permease protein